MAENRKARRASAALRRRIKSAGVSTSASIEVDRVRVPKARLAELPREDRAFLFMLGHIANEISILQKHFWFSSNYRHPPGVAQHVHASQALLSGKLVTGKLKEAWQFIETALLRSKLGRTYTPLLDQQATDALEELKKYFGKSNLIGVARNDFIFHYSTKDYIERLHTAFEKIDDQQFEFYLSNTQGNSHWFASETVINAALLEAIQPDNHNEAMDRLIRETVSVARWITTFADHCMVTILQHHLGDEFLNEISSETLTIRNVPDPNRVGIPFFVQDRPPTAPPHSATGTGTTRPRATSAP